ncbi:HAD family hydrolase [Zobellella taiwanensis]|jgi:HAD superfamily hydrolase (TIGR01490 family)|uniref:HAD-IB family hydrolase n=1 Tax=Zobellella taiwanensis TaxID=347535 RepID=A0A2P7R4A0_9GAMM|nr:HAD family hydrolase [Zobellella taiwanensis]PSJ45053.1 HAD-IB family hydrolase [Zobellella taiwanensis]
MALAIFDLDETLIAGDSASLWLAFLAREGRVSEALLAEERRLMADYYQGEMDMEAYMTLTLSPLQGRRPDELAPLVTRFIEHEIAPLVYPQARATLDWHRRQGHRCLIISATAEYLVAPIALSLGVEQAIGIEAQLERGRYNGRARGVFSYRQGKVTRLTQWLERQGLSPAFSYGYSDSHNDLPLLEYVDEAAVVNAAAPLADIAASRGWRQLSWTL